MHIQHAGAAPRVHPTAYVAPNAVLSGDVTVGAHTSILYGAVLTADGGPVEIGSHCVVMENAVVRGAPGCAARIGDHVLIGPHAHVSGCTVERDCFLATGSVVFNGVHLGREVEVRIHGVVHVNSVLPEESVVPIGWIAVGDPAEILPPERHEDIWPIQRSMGFRETVWKMGREASRAEITDRYARSLTRHRDDEIL